MHGSTHLKTCTVGHGIRFHIQRALHPYSAYNSHTYRHVSAKFNNRLLYKGAGEGMTSGFN